MFALSKTVNFSIYNTRLTLPVFRCMGWGRKDVFAARGDIKVDWAGRVKMFFEWSSKDE